MCTELLLGHHRDEDHWYTAPVRQSPSPPGLEDTETATSRHLRSARGNGLDLRPATAAGVSGSQGMNSPSQDASATRQTDLGSLSAQLFAPRPQVQGHVMLLLLLLLLLACRGCLAWLHAHSTLLLSVLTASHALGEDTEQAVHKSV